MSQAIEDARRKQSTEKKMKERRELAQIVSEADYDKSDRIRASRADESAWLEFEVRMRSLMQCVLRPIVEMSTTDRE